MSGIPVHGYLSADGLFISNSDLYTTLFFERSAGLELEKCDARIKELLRKIWHCGGSVSGRSKIHGLGGKSWPAIELSPHARTAPTERSVSVDRRVSERITLEVYLEHKLAEFPVLL